MLKDITLGQYFPGNTLAHRLDPRTKLMMVIIYIVALFCAKSFVSYGILALFLVVSVKISKVGFRAMIRGMKPLIVILIFTAVLNMFYTPGREIASFWIFRVTVEGIWAAAFMVLRIAMLIMGTFLMTYTTSPIALTDAIENLLGPLKKLHVPVHELAMMMSIALRAKAMVPILVPLFISAIRRADELATAMECRCYHGGEGRTKLHVLRYQRRDFLCILLTTVITAAVVIIGRLGY